MANGSKKGSSPSRLAAVEKRLEDLEKEMPETVDELVEDSLDQRLPRALAVIHEQLASYGVRLNWLEKKIEKRGRPPKV